MDAIRTYLDMFNLSTLGIHKLGLNGVVDIAIMTYLIYKITLWIKETRAWSLFKGLVVMMVASALSYAFQLNTLSWLMSNMFAVGVTVVVVIFQPEVRKALEQIGKGGFLSGIMLTTDESANSSPQTMQEIITAVWKMAKVKTGALIIVERHVGLGDISQTGIAIDGIVSSQLLINIFENKTPLHDGAVIIRNNRVAAASCILPLTQTEIGSELGTRHRAATGASEVSDAYSIVVSEETGGVSVAIEGNLYKHLTEEQLRNILLEDIKPVKRKKALWKGRSKNEKNK